MIISILKQILFHGVSYLSVSQLVS